MKWFWLLVDHEHELEGKFDKRPLRCAKCHRGIEFDGEWNCWATVEEAEAKRKRKDDFFRAIAEVQRNHRQGDE